MEKILDYKKIRKIGLVVRLNTNLSGDILHLAEILANFNVEILLENECAKTLNSMLNLDFATKKINKNSAQIQAQIPSKNLNLNTQNSSKIQAQIPSKNLNLNTQNSSKIQTQIPSKNLNCNTQNSTQISSKNLNFSTQNSTQISSKNSNFSTQISSPKNSHKKLKFKGFCLDELFENSDFIISLGGDGTLISLCRKACEYDKALLGINAGHLGFLTDFTISGAAAFFEDFFKGKFRIEQPFLLDIILKTKQGKRLEKLAFNDIVFSRLNSGAMTEISVLRKGKVFNEYYGDGLIVATPAGSTAYNLSANGPIIYTLAEVFLLTPVCSHSLTQRPIVLPKGFELEIRAKECEFCIDGQEFFKTSDFSSIHLRLSEKKVRLIHPKNRDYFQILKEKLHWGK